MHADLLTDKTHINSLVVTEFPTNSVGNHFNFIVKVFSKQAVNGVASNLSDPMILGDVPDQPPTVPTRNAQSGEYIIAVNIGAVSGINGSPISSYHVEIDDGQGGIYTEIKGGLADDLTLFAKRD